jgi:hypothetical protein
MSPCTAKGRPYDSAEIMGRGKGKMHCHVVGTKQQEKTQRMGNKKLPCSGHADAHLSDLLLSNKFLCSEAKGVKSVNRAQTSQEGVQCPSYFVTILVDDFSIGWERSTVRQNLFPRFFISSVGTPF